MTLLRNKPSLRPVIRRGVLGFLLSYLLVGGAEVVSNVVFWTVVAVIFGGLVVFGFTGIFVGVVARKPP